MTLSEAMNFLGFSPGSYTKEQVTDAYRKLARKFHPDVPGGSTEQFQKLDEAYRVATGHPSTAGRSWHYESRSSYDSRDFWKAWEETFNRARAREQAGREQYDYQDRQRHRTRSSYHAGVTCGKGNHKWVYKETSSFGGYYKCSVCGATKTKTTRAKSSSDYRSRVGDL